SSLHEVRRVKRIDDLATNVDRRPYLVDSQLLLRSDRNFRHIGDIAGVRKLECEAETCSFGKLVTTVLPIRHISHRREDAKRSFSIERSAKRNFSESWNR